MKKMLGKVFFALIFFGFLTNSVSAKEFSDLTPNYWAKKEIKELAKENVVVGYPDGTFMADNPVTKAEFVTMVIKALWQENYEHQEIYYYKDVPQNHWAYEMIEIASDFDLLEGYPDGYFKPDENLKKAEAVKIVISSVDAGNITEPMARNYLSVYKDAAKIPAWAVIPAGKAQKFSLIANPPGQEKYFSPEKFITRGEMAVMLYNMRKQALLHPNKKLSKVFTPKKANGIKLENVEMEPNGFIADVPAGTIIQGKLADDPVNSQNALLNGICVVKTEENYVTRQNYLLIPAGTNVAGEIISVKRARYFLRNAKMDIEGKRITLEEGYSSDINAEMYPNAKKQGWFSRIYRAIVKGKKIIINKGDTVYVKLTKPVRIDTAKTMIVPPLSE